MLKKTLILSTILLSIAAAVACLRMRATPRRAERLGVVCTAPNTEPATVSPRTGIEAQPRAGRSDAKAERLGDWMTGAAAKSPEDLVQAMDEARSRALLAALGGMTTAERCLAAWILSWSPWADVSARLVLELRREPEEEVRLALVRALQNRGDEEAGRGLIEALAADPSDEVRCAAAYALGDRCRSSPTAFAGLATALATGRSVRVRAAAADALGMAPSADTAEALVAALSSPSAEVRSAAARSLGRQRGLVSEDVLASAERTEPDREVRAALAEARLALSGELSIDDVGGCGQAASEDAPHHHGEDGGR